MIFPLGGLGFSDSMGTEQTEVASGLFEAAVTVQVNTGRDGHPSLFLIPSSCAANKNALEH